MFSKVLAKYYQKWYADCIQSANYCDSCNRWTDMRDYLEAAEKYRIIIENNKEAIEFFSIDDNAFLIDSALPEKFRGYK